MDTLIPDLTATLPGTIISHLYKQLMSFHNMLDARGADQCHPTAPELNMQTKMINNIVKVKKLNAVDHTSKLIQGFFRQLGKEDKQLAKTMSDKFYSFIGMGNNPDAAVINTEVAVENPAAQNQGNNIIQPAPSAPAPLPVTEADFDEYVAVLREYYSANEKSIIPFNGRYVKRYWLEHNLVQHTLLPYQQKFIAEENFVHDAATRSSTVKDIERYLNKRGW